MVQYRKRTIGKFRVRQIEKNHIMTYSGGTVRGLLRNYGVSNSKRLARKALSRRGFTN